MRVGTICYATDQGLGILAKSFYDHGIVTDVLVIRHAHHSTHDEWYPGAPQVGQRNFDIDLAKWFCKSVDVMLFFETPFDWRLIPYCREVNTKSVLMPMHECTPDPLPAIPDLFLCPSHLDYREFFSGDKSRAVYLPVPVDVPHRLRTEANVFVHNAGHLGLRWRNGTLELLQAMKYVTPNLKLIVRGQTVELNQVLHHVPEIKHDQRVSIEIGTVPYSDLWKKGDVFVFPEKFNGLSLPLQEAYGAGMLVMCGNRFPMNEWLPTDPMIPVKDYTNTRVGSRYRWYQEAIIDPVSIAATMNDWFGRDITNYSLLGSDWAKEHSWEVLKPQYLEVLAQCA